MYSASVDERAARESNQKLYLNDPQAFAANKFASKVSI
jgi:hypothetical protein